MLISPDHDDRFAGVDRHVRGPYVSGILSAKAWPNELSNDLTHVAQIINRPSVITDQWSLISDQ